MAIIAARDAEIREVPLPLRYYATLGGAVIVSASALPSAPQILPCWRCGVVPVLDPNDGYPIVACSDCYDGAPDSSTRSDLGAGLNSREAIEAWNEKAREGSACEPLAAHCQAGGK